MTEFTVIYYDYGLYSSNKVKIKRIMSNHGLKWNASKYVEHNIEETVNSFKIFGYIDKINNDDNLKNRTSSSGIWESSSEAIKAIMLEKRNEEEHLPVMLIFKGTEGSDFYTEFVNYCVKLGCWVSKVVQEDDKFTEIFKKRINIELVEKLNNIQLSKSSMKENFLNKISEYKKHGHDFSDTFINGWQDCIQKYGYYSLKDLLNEIEKKNELKNDVSKNEVQGKNVAECQPSAMLSNNERVFTKKKFTIKMKNVTG